MEQRQDCHGTIFGPYNRTSDSTWQSDNTSVFTVSAGTVSCLQPGSGTVTAQFQAIVYGQWCNPISIYPRPSGPVTVFRLRIGTAGTSIHYEDSDSGASIIVQDITGDGRAGIIVTSAIGASIGATFQAFSFDGESLTEIARIEGHHFEVINKGAGKAGCAHVSSNRPSC
jgi:hypothetical protein